MEFLLLGPFEARDDAGRPLAVGRRRERCLLGLLLLQPGRAISAQRLASLLWEEAPPRDPGAALRTYASRLRARLGELGEGGPRIVATRGGYLVEADPESIDVHRFARLAGQTRETSPADQRACLLDQALALWRGPLLADVGSDTIRRRVGAELAELRLLAIRMQVDAKLSLGRHSELIGLLSGMVAEHPLDETLVSLLMLTYYRAGRSAEALNAYQRLRTGLTEALGSDPGLEVQQRYLAILRRDPTLDPHLAPPADASSAPAAQSVATPQELPSRVRHFTARTDALEALDSLSPNGDQTDAAILVIAGSPGVGKTALALEWAHRAAGRFPDGQLYVNLRGYDPADPVDADYALDGLLRSLGSDPAAVPVGLAERTALFRSLLAGRKVLLLLDNARSAEQVRPLLPGEPGCFVLVTSRDALPGLVARDGAQRLHLDRLAEPAAVALLRAILGDPRIDREPEAAQQLARACSGLPLALRVAAERAARREGQPLAEIAAELADRSHGLDALDVPHDPRSAMREVFSWSYRALSPQAAGLFRLLGLHPGPDIGPAAVARLSDVDARASRRMLDELAGAHLLEPGPDGRYRMHDLLRTYAVELVRVLDGEAVRRSAVERLFLWYAATADAAVKLLYPDFVRLPVVQSDGERFGSFKEALAWLDAERANLVAAMCATGMPEVESRWIWGLYDAARVYLVVRRHLDDLLACGRVALTALGDPPDARAACAVHLGISGAHLSRDQHVEAIIHLTGALEHATLAGWQDGRAAALSNLGVVRWGRGQLRLAAQHFVEAVATYHGQGRRDEMAATKLLGLAAVQLELGELHAAAASCHRALEISQEARSRNGIMRSRQMLGRVDLWLGRLDEAVEHLSVARDHFREVGDWSRESTTLENLAAVHRQAGRHELALKVATEALRVQSEAGERRDDLDAWATLGTIQVDAGHCGKAIECLDRVLAIAQRSGRTILQLAALIGLATAHRRVGLSERARSYALQALEMARRAGYRLHEGQALTELARIEDVRNRPEAGRALALRALETHRQTGHRPGEQAALELLHRLQAQPV